MSYSQRLLLACLIVPALVGVGCQSKIEEYIKPPATGPQPSELSGVNSAEASKRINLVPGSVIETRQTFLGFGAHLSAAMAGAKQEGTRTIVIERFAPGQVANVYWKLLVQSESDESKKARETAQRQKKTIPEPVMVDRVSQGSIEGLNLKMASSLYPPSYWPEQDKASGLGTSGLWLSSDQFAELSRNRIATLDLGILNDAIQGVVKGSPEFLHLFSTLRSQVASAEKSTDVFLLKGDADPIDWKLNVNGKDVMVQVFKAHSWFGEVIVLNNPQNPLVLKLTFNPLSAGAAGVLNGDAALKALLGYEVTAIRDAQE